MKSVMEQSANLSIVDLLDSRSLSDEEVRRLVGWQALILVDLLRRRCITVRYAEQMLFNLDVVQRLEQQRLKDCVEVVDWGMQLEDWEAHTSAHLPEALSTIAQLARRLLTPVHKGKSKRKSRDRSSQSLTSSRRESRLAG
jgi:ribosome-associated translation inhibitor RaiA